jgi:hypothetical protein
MTALSPEAAWCRNLFDGLAEGGIWGIPRSGLIFTRLGDKLVLTAAMPWDPAMPITEAQLAEQQNGEFEAVRENFAAAGVTVERSSHSPS